MLFNFFERDALINILDKHAGSLDILDKEEEQFLQEKNLLRFQRNHIIFPKNVSRKTNAENITIITTLGGDFELSTFIREILDCLTPPFQIMIDFGFLLFHPMSHEFRYVWAERYTALPLPTRIFTDNERDDYFNSFISMDISSTVLDVHANQSHFDASGFVFRRFLTCTVFLSKIPDV